MATAKLLSKHAYGLDNTGEVIDSNQPNIEDQAEPGMLNATQPNPANRTRDYEAEEDFPELQQRRSIPSIKGTEPVE
jgi:hypothetical protein